MRNINVGDTVQCGDDTGTVLRLAVSDGMVQAYVQFSRETRWVNTPDLKFVSAPELKAPEPEVEPEAADEAKED